MTKRAPMARGSRARFWGAACVAATAAAARFALLGSQSIWNDEGFSIWVSMHPAHAIPHLLRMDVAPPLFYLFLHSWMKFAGLGEAQLRLPFAFFGVLNAVLVYEIGLLIISPPAALISGELWACSFAALNAETQVRMYAMTVFFTLLATWLLMKAVSRKLNFLWGGYLASVVLALYSHYASVFVLFGHVLFMVLRKRWKMAGVVSFVLAASFLPWLPVFLRQLRFGAARIHPPASWSGFLYMFSYFTGMFDFIHSPWENLMFALASVGACIIGLTVAWRTARENPARLLPAVLFLSAGLFPFVIGKFTLEHIFISHLYIFILPYYILLAVLGLWTISPLAASTIAILLIGANLVFWSLFLTGPSFQREDWRDAARFLRSHVRPGDAVMFEQPYAAFGLWYYLPDQFRLLTGRGDYFFIDSVGSVLWQPINPRLPNYLDTVEDVAKHTHRQWLLLWQERNVDPDERVKRLLDSRGMQVISRLYPSLYQDEEFKLLLYVPKRR